MATRASRETSGHRAVQAHRRRRQERGIVRMEVQAPALDAGLLREVAQALRAEPERAEALRSGLRSLLYPRPPVSLWEALRCDLPDEVVDDALARPRDTGRDVPL
jgi:hypothetical protein